MDVCLPGRTVLCVVVVFFCSPPELRDGGDPSVSGLCAGFGSSGVPTGGRSPARQASMPDSPPQAIHGLLSASPGRDAASAIRCRGFFIGNRRSRAVGRVGPAYVGRVYIPDVPFPPPPRPGGPV